MTLFGITHQFYLALHHGATVDQTVLQLMIPPFLQKPYPRFVLSRTNYYSLFLEVALVILKQMERVARSARTSIRYH